MKWDAVELCQPLRIRVIADDERDFAVQLAAFPTIKQIGQAMVVVRHKNRHPRPDLRELQSPVHLKPPGNRRKFYSEPLCVENEPAQVPFDSGQKKAQVRVLMLVGMKDIGVVAKEEIRHHCDDPFAVGAIDQHDGGLDRKSTRLNSSHVSISYAV